MSLAYLFGDERFEASQGTRQIRAALALVDQGLWARAAAATDLRRIPKEERHASLLRSMAWCGGHLLLSHVNLPEEACTAGDRHVFTDIGSVSAANRRWSDLMGCSAGHLILIATGAGARFDQVDFHLDPFTLGGNHSAAFEEFLVEQLRVATAEALEPLGVRNIPWPQVRRVGWQPKRRENRPASKLQLGVEAVDAALRLPCETLESILGSSLHRRDLTEPLLRAWNKSRIIRDERDS